MQVRVKCNQPNSHVKYANIKIPMSNCIQSREIVIKANTTDPCIRDSGQSVPENPKRNMIEEKAGVYDDVGKGKGEGREHGRFAQLFLLACLFSSFRNLRESYKLCK